jgi:hypothetical protein
MSEWGNPAGIEDRSGTDEYIVRVRETRGTETSKYPQEEKSNEIPPVVASESGTGQTVRRKFCGVMDCDMAKICIVE